MKGLSHTKQFFEWQKESEKLGHFTPEAVIFWSDKMSEVVRRIQDSEPESAQYNLPLLFIVNEMYRGVRSGKKDTNDK